MTAAKPENGGSPSRNWLVLLIYVELSAGIFGISVLRHPASAYIGSGPDPTLMMWSLVWWPHALLHRINPFLTDLIWSPTGFNLAWATTLPALSLIVSPITLAFGPVVSYNLLCILAPALSSWTAYLLCRRITRAFWPSVVGGYVFGFSSYEIGHMLSGQLHLASTFIPPICVYLVLVFVDGQIGRLAFTLLLALSLCTQFLISTEIFATMTVFGAMAIALAGLLFPREIRHRLLSAGVCVIGAYALAAVFLGPYLYYVFAFGVPGAPIFSPETYSLDLLQAVIPTPVTLVGHRTFETLTAGFVGNDWENGGYVGIGLILVLVLFGSRFWRQARGKLLLATLMLIWLASLGPVLHFAGAASLPLPWKVALHLPLLNNAMPARFMMYGFLLLGIIVAIWASDERIKPWLRWTLVGLSIFLLLPAPRYVFASAKVDPPAFFADGLYRTYLSPGEHVLVIPFGGNGKSMLWQAQTDMYFRMVGGWTGMAPVEFQHWPILRTFYFEAPIPQQGEQLKLFLAAHRVGKIVVDERSRQPWEGFLSVLGVQPLRIGGVLLYRPPSSLAQ